jgi:hypothetical protein
MMRNTLLAAAGLALAAACTPSIDGEQAIADMTARSNWSTDSVGSFAIVQRLQQAAGQAEDDSLWARYELAAGDLESQIPSRALFAIRHYMRVVDSLPDRFGPRALFAVATTFDVGLGDQLRAGQAYELFLQRYPQHPWAGRVDTLLTLTRSNADSLLLQQIQAQHHE